MPLQINQFQKTFRLILIAAVAKQAEKSQSGQRIDIL